MKIIKFLFSRPFVGGIGNTADVSNDVSELFFLKLTSPPRHHGRLPYRTPSLGDDLQQEFIAKFVHYGSVRMVSGFYREGPRGGPVSLPVIPMAAGAIGKIKFFPLGLILCPSQVDLGQ